MVNKDNSTGHEHNSSANLTWREVISHAANNSSPDMIFMAYKIAQKLGFKGDLDSKAVSDYLSWKSNAIKTVAESATRLSELSPSSINILSRRKADSLSLSIEITLPGGNLIQMTARQGANGGINVSHVPPTSEFPIPPQKLYSVISAVANYVSSTEWFPDGQRVSMSIDDISEIVDQKILSASKGLVWEGAVSADTSQLDMTIISNLSARIAQLSGGGGDISTLKQVALDQKSIDLKRSAAEKIFNDTTGRSGKEINISGMNLSEIAHDFRVHGNARVLADHKVPVITHQTVEDALRIISPESISPPEIPRSLGDIIEASKRSNDLEGYLKQLKLPSEVIEKILQELQPPPDEMKLARWASAITETLTSISGDDPTFITQLFEAAKSTKVNGGKASVTNDEFKALLEKSALPPEVVSKINQTVKPVILPSVVNTWARAATVYQRVLGSIQDVSGESKTDPGVIHRNIKVLAELGPANEIVVDAYYALLNTGNPLRVGGNATADLSELEIFNTTTLPIALAKQLGFTLKFVIVNEATEVASLLGQPQEIVDSNLVLIEEHLKRIGYSENIEVRSMRGDIREILSGKLTPEQLLHLQGSIIQAKATGRILGPELQLLDDLLASSNIDSIEDWFDALHKASYKRIAKTPQNAHRERALALGFTYDKLLEIGLNEDEIEKIFQATVTGDESLIPQKALDAGWEAARQFDSIMNLRGLVPLFAEARGIEIPPEFREATVHASITRKPSKAVIEFWRNFMGQSRFATHGIAVLTAHEKPGNVALWEVLLNPHMFRAHVVDDKIVAFEFLPDDLLAEEIIQEEYRDFLRRWFGDHGDDSDKSNSEPDGGLWPPPSMPPSSSGGSDGGSARLDRFSNRHASVVSDREHKFNRGADTHPTDTLTDPGLESWRLPSAEDLLDPNSPEFIAAIGRLAEIIYTPTDEEELYTYANPNSYYSKSRAAELLREAQQRVIDNGLTHVVRRALRHFDDQYSLLSRAAPQQAEISSQSLRETLELIINKAEAVFTEARTMWEKGEESRKRMVEYAKIGLKVAATITTGLVKMGAHNLKRGVQSGVNWEVQHLPAQAQAVRNAAELGAIVTGETFKTLGNVLGWSVDQAAIALAEHPQVRDTLGKELITSIVIASVLTVFFGGNLPAAITATPYLWGMLKGGKAGWDKFREAAQRSYDKDNLQSAYATGEKWAGRMDDLRPEELGTAKAELAEAQRLLGQNETHDSEYVGEMQNWLGSLQGIVSSDKTYNEALARERSERNEQLRQSLSNSARAVAQGITGFFRGKFEEADTLPMAISDGSDTDVGEDLSLSALSNQIQKQWEGKEMKQENKSDKQSTANDTLPRVQKLQEPKKEQKPIETRTGDNGLFDGAPTTWDDSPERVIDESRGQGAAKKAASSTTSVPREKKDVKSSNESVLKPRLTSKPTPQQVPQTQTSSIQSSAPIGSFADIMNNLGNAVNRKESEKHATHRPQTPQEEIAEVLSHVGDNGLRRIVDHLGGNTQGKVSRISVEIALAEKLAGNHQVASQLLKALRDDILSGSAETIVDKKEMAGTHEATLVIKRIAERENRSKVL